MKHITLNVAQLIASQSNVRDGHSKVAIANMAHSIKQGGIINAPCVAKNGVRDDGTQNWEIIAGRLRTLGAEAAELEEVVCRDVSNLSEAERIELSLSENVDRERMTEVELYRAFDKIRRAGRSVAEIASRFDKTERDVERLLAIGGLPKSLLNAYDKGDIGERTITSLAIAGKQVVARYSKLKKSERPRDWEIKDWIEGADGWFRKADAVFDVNKYDGPVVVDLFDESDDNVIFTDGQQFRALQNQAVEAKLQEYRDRGITVTKLDYWQNWNYERLSLKKGGKVYWTQNNQTLATTFYVGYTTQKKGKETPAASQKSGEDKAPKPELSSTFSRYMDELRHNAVRNGLIGNHGMTYAVLIVSLVRGIDNLQPRDEYLNYLKSDKWKQAVEASTDHEQILKDYNEVTEPFRGKQSPASMLKVLLEYKDDDLAYILTVCTAMHWHITYDPAFSNAVGKAMALDVVTSIDPSSNDEFLSGVTNKQTLLAIAKDAGITVNDNATGNSIRQVLSAHMPADYTPKWLRF